MQVKRWIVRQEDAAKRDQDALTPAWELESEVEVEEDLLVEEEENVNGDLVEWLHDWEENNKLSQVVERLVYCSMFSDLSLLSYHTR